MDKIDGKVFRGMLESGNNNLNGRKKDVDALNVFPVPDGDTGTNMCLTFSNGINEVLNSGSDSLSVIAKTLSRGLLMGARGNSGVILSQIFRGFYQYIGDREELTVKEYSEALLNGSKLAYKAVMRPVEGTILTVVRESTETCNIYLEKNPEMSIEEFMEMLCKEAKDSLDRTPELLPVLKEAHVVDSGGAGLVIILDGFKAFLNGNPITSAEEVEKSTETKNDHASGYRTEFILDFDEKHSHSFNEDRFRKSLEQLGNKLTLLVDEKTVKVRVNSMTPGEVLMLAERYGGFRKVQIESVQDEMNSSILDEEEANQPAEAKEFGLIAVAAGDGLKKLFTEYRVDVVVSGGQTMNPSTEDIVSAIKKINAKHIYILPNNGNIIMAANQAAQVTEDKEIIVLPTKSVPEGLSACINFNPDEDVDVNTSAMSDAIAHVKTGSITYAVKDTTIEGREIHSGDFMSIFGKEIVYTSKNKMDATKQLITEMCDEDSEIVTVIKGLEATDDECEEVKKFIEDNFEVDVDLQDGGQPVYSFFIGVE